MVNGAKTSIAVITLETFRFLFLSYRDISNPAGGGGTALIHRIMRELAEQGHEVTLICERHSNKPSRSNIDNIEIMRTLRPPLMFVSAAYHYVSKLKGSFDLAVESVIALPWFSPLYMNEKKVAVFFHILKDQFYVELSRYGRSIGYPAATIGYLIEKSMGRFYRNTPIVTFSKSTANDLIEYGFPKENIKVVQEGIDLKKYKAPASKDSFPHLIYVGRLKRYKGVQFIIKAMKYLVAEYPRSKLSIVGRGDYENELRRLVSNLDLQSNVIFHGYVSEIEKIDLLGRSHILVMPSLREGWATPVIEANARGTPSVVFDTIGVGDTVIHGVTGFKTSYGNIGELVAYCSSLLNDKELYSRMQNNALAFASRFDLSETERQVVEFLLHQLRF